MSVRRAKPSVTGDKREEVEHRAGLKNALLARKDIVAVREEGHDCSMDLQGLQKMWHSFGRDQIPL
jgi:hypothetical protein